MGKKVALATFHSANNYGAVLQCYALATSIKNIGCDCFVIDYRPERFNGLYYVSCKRSFRHPGIKYTIQKTRNLATILKRNKNFENFREKYIPFSNKKYFKYENILKEDINADVYVTGSDQVWNDKCADFDPFYFFHTSAFNNTNKVSYAASFNFSDIPEGLKNDYYDRLKDFQEISVREPSGVTIITELLDKDVTVCCDPTLLLKKEWISFSQDIDENENYIFVYCVLENSTVLERAKQLSLTTHLKVIVVPGLMDEFYLRGVKEKEMGFTVINDCGPDRFLSLIKNAKYVVTNSFHGTVFSILYHKQFLTQIKLATGKNNLRIEELMRIAGIKGRLVENNLSNIDENVDWDVVDRNVEEVRNKSMDYLRKVLDSQRLIYGQ